MKILWLLAFSALLSFFNYHSSLQILYSINGVCAFFFMFFVIKENKNLSVKFYKIILLIISILIPYFVHIVKVAKIDNNPFHMIYDYYSVIIWEDMREIPYGIMMLFFIFMYLFVYFRFSEYMIKRKTKNYTEMNGMYFHTEDKAYSIYFKAPWLVGYPILNKFFLCTKNSRIEESETGHSLLKLPAAFINDNQIRFLNYVNSSDDECYR